MGVLNCTPDSFSDGGDFISPANAVAQAQQMIAQGASIIDIGGESTAPHATKVSAEIEWGRIESVLRNIADLSINVSLDSYKAEIWEKALSINPFLWLNDVSGLQTELEKKIALLKRFPLSRVVVMFSRSLPYKSDSLPLLLDSIDMFFQKTLTFLLENGISLERIILDPGMGGFLSPDPKASFCVLQNLSRFQKYKCPLLIGTSRKSFLREVSHPSDPKQRQIASVITSTEAWKNGASIIRVHDVLETNEALQTLSALYTCKYLNTSEKS